MPRIPMGNFGGAMPQVERIQMPQSNIGQLGAAIGNLGNTVNNIAQRKDQQQREQEAAEKRLALYNDQVAEAEAKVKLDDVLTSEMSEQVTLLKNEVSNGTVNATVANQNLQKWSDDRYKQLQAEMPGHAQNELKQYWDANISKQAPGFLPLQLRADAQKSVALADRVTEIATRYERKAGREYLETNLASANMPEAEKQERLYKYETVRDGMDIDGRITDAVSAKNTTDLHTLITDLDSGKYGYIDGPTLQQKKNQVLSRIDAIDTQVKAEENKRNSEASKMLNEYKSNVLTGRAQDPDYEANVGQLVAGTDSEAEFKFLQQQSVNFQRFANKSTSEQQKLINEQKAKMKNTPSSSAADEEKILSVYEDIYKNKVQTAKNNPNQLVREAGVKVNSLGGTSLSTNTNQWIDGAIDNGMSQLALKDANINVKPISDEDLPEAKKAFDGMSVNDKLSFIGGLINKSKGVPNGSKIWEAVLGQLSVGDQNYIAAGVAKMNNFKSTEGRYLATSIVNGTQLLKNKQLIMPKDDDLRAAFNAYVGNTEEGTSSNTSYEVFKAVYADTMDARGLTHTKSDELPNKEVLSVALAFFTGGIYKQPGTFRNYMDGKLESWKVDKPYGMTDDKFEEILEVQYPKVARYYGVTVAELKTLKLKRIKEKGKGGVIRYALINERKNPLYYLNMPAGVTK